MAPPSLAGKSTVLELMLLHSGTGCLTHTPRVGDLSPAWVLLFSGDVSPSLLGNTGIPSMPPAPCQWWLCLICFFHLEFLIFFFLLGATHPRRPFFLQHLQSNTQKPSWFFPNQTCSLLSKVCIIYSTHIY